MTDRELLELAAKAAGIEIDSWLNDSPVVVEMFRGHLPNYEDWNPLTDDGDALRLAVDLWIEVRVFNGKAHAGKQNKFWCTEAVGEDSHAAARRAIVCAAAEIGRGTL